MARRVFGAALALLVIVTLAVGITAGSIYLYGQRFSDGPADAAVVLGAAVFTSRPSPVFVERLRHALELYQAGRVRKIVISGGQAPGDTLSEAAAGRDWLVARGLPPADAILEDQSRNTFQNIAYVKPLLAANGLSSVLIDSDPLHMQRAMSMALDAGLAAQPSPTPTTRYHSIDTILPMLWSETWQFIGYRLSGR